jgi:2,4-dienoyl-CoA reductase-like NADH-dependent reductase (Old Yellow Enzyme family)
LYQRNANKRARREDAGYAGEAAIYAAVAARGEAAQSDRRAADASIFGPTDWHLINVGKFAAGGAGLVIIESTKVERRGCGTVGDLGIWDDAFVEPLSRLVKFIKQQNALAGIQLGHSGRKARANRPWEGDGPLQHRSDIDDWDGWQPVAPSPIAHSEKWPVPKALERHEVKDLVQAWGEAARRAAGFDVLEPHGAHGYLVHQSNRMRFITEIAEAVRVHWPDHKPLFVPLSVEDHAGWGPDQIARLAKILKARGVDVIDCSSGGISDAAPILGRESATTTRCRYRTMSAITPR